MNIGLEPVDIDTGSDDREGMLVNRDGRLVAILVRLSEGHDGAGKWFVEAGFGMLRDLRDTTFPTLETAREWFASQMTSAPSATSR